MLTIKKALLPLACTGLMFAGAASADVDITISNESGNVGNTVVVTYAYSALDADDVGGFQFDITYDPAMLTPTDVSNCGNNAPATHTPSCTEPGGAGSGTIRTIIADFSAPTDEIMPLNTDPMGEFTFQIDAPGVHTLTFTNASAADISGGAVTIAGTDGSITGNIVGTSFYQSTPAVGDTVDFGGAVANTTTAAQTITVDNISSDTDFDITAASGTSGGATIGATVVGGTPATVPGDGAGGTTVDVDFECTPTARGAQSGTLDIDNDSDNEGPTASYNFDCAGLAPNVQVPAGPFNIAGLTTDPNPLTDTATVTNPEDGFTSDAMNVTATAVGDPEITVTPAGPLTIATDGSQDFTLECDNSAQGNFTSTITIEWDDPVSGGTATDSFDVNCDVSDAFPVYESTPAVGSLIDFGTVTNGDTSAPMGVDVGNSMGQGPAPDSDLNITGATASDPAFTVTVVDPGPFAAGDGPDGTDDIEVTCSPTTAGVITATLNVETDDPAQPAGGFEYDLECEGVSDGAFDSTPPPGGTLNLGVVEPGGTSPIGEIVFENNGTQDSIDVDCTLTDPDGVFTMTPDPVAFTIDPGGSDTAEFQCSPETAESFSATLNCDITGDPDTTTAEYTILCQGQPLVIPTMSRWGLIALFAMLLVVGGLATRRLVSN